MSKSPNREIRRLERRVEMMRKLLLELGVTKKTLKRKEAQEDRLAAAEWKKAEDANRPRRNDFANDDADFGGDWRFLQDKYNR